MGFHTGRAPDSAPGKCICCGGDWNPLVDFGDVPRSGVYLSTPDADIPTARLAYEYCGSCGLIRRRPVRAATDYSRSDRTTGHWRPEYEDRLVEMVGRGPRGLVVEVGANDGSFLARLRDHGFDELLGLEPSESCARTARERGLDVEAALLDEAAVARILDEHGLATCVVCRHVIEHVDSPVDFLTRIKNLLKEQGVALLEIPTSRGVLERIQIHELWEEHIHLFSAAGFLDFLAHNGMVPIESWTAARNIDENLVALVRPGMATAGADLTAEVSLCRRFPGRWAAFRARWLKATDSWKRPVIALGASHPQRNLITYTGLPVDFLVDDDPNKKGTFAPVPAAIPVLSTEQAVRRRPGTILETAFGYPQWTAEVAEMLPGAERVSLFDESERPRGS